MSEYGPEPWRAVKFPGYWEICDSEDRLIAAVHWHKSGAKIFDANAHLIVAAPAMFKALETIERNTVHANTRMIARAAIAKAKKS